MSKNNFSERLRKMQPKKDHYSIRKFSVGVASVLIGFSFLGLANSQVVKADSSQEVAESSENKTASSSEVSEEQKQVAQNGQEKLDEGQESLSNSESEQKLSAIKAAAVQAVQKQEANETAIKSSNLTGTAKSGQKIAADIGLTGRKDVQGTVKGLTSEKQEITLSSVKSSKDQSEKDSTVSTDKADTVKNAGAKADAVKNNQAKSDETSSIVNAKSDAVSEAADSEKSSNNDYQIDTQSLDSLSANKAESDKSGKTDQADDLAKELSANLTTDKSGQTNKLTLKGNGTEDKLASGSEQTLNIDKTVGLDTKKKALMLKSEKVPDTSAAEVSDWNGLANAMENTNINTINLTGDITVTGKIDGKGTNPPVVSQPNPAVNSGKLNLGGWAFFKYSATNIARNLTINGHGHALNFGKYYISFTTNNQKNGTP